MILAALILAVIAFALLAAAMDRHAAQLSKAWPIRQKTPLRLVAAALLAGSLTASLAALGAAYGTIAWFGILTVGAAFVLLFLSWREARRKHRTLRA